MGYNYFFPFLFLLTRVCPSLQNGTNLTTIVLRDDSPSLIIGTNLGNTLEAPEEGQWAPAAQEYFFDDFASVGFNMVRIPIRWDNHTLEHTPYTINSTFLDRVKLVVSWCMSRGFQCIINSHWDSWLDTNDTIAFNTVLPRFSAIWTQVANAFIDAGPNLFFESFNEPHIIDTPKLNTLLSTFYNATRPLHPNRTIIFGWLNYMGPSWIEEDHNSNWNAMFIPNDDPNIMVECHSYDPYDVCGSPKRQWNSKPSDILNMNFMFETLSNWSQTHNNIPVLMGESGCIRTQNQSSRVAWYNAFYERVRNTTGVRGGLVWDDNGDFQIYNRSSRKFDEEVIHAIGL
jgi:endoglucanase